MRFIHMRKILFTLSVLFISMLSFSQTEKGLDVNPNVQWRFVRTHDISLLSGQLQTYEFPANRKFDYIVNLEMKQDSVDVELYIYDMQSKLIAKHSAKNTHTTQFEFGVFHNATYQVMVRVRKHNSDELIEVKSLMSLLQRAKI